MRKSEKGDAYAKCTLCNWNVVSKRVVETTCQDVTESQHTAKFMTAGPRQENGSFCKPTSTMPYKLTEVPFSTFMRARTTCRLLCRPVEVSVSAVVL